ncbi:hypothetical protein [Micromonospora chokoriensis]|uniref:hypothetical protein n=1 Tax=Micromonospora chokoriensis TaxID=356851 RepID=UPI0018DE16C8|nr:hypothetical protein [Micromonospora chokoriensis]
MRKPGGELGFADAAQAGQHLTHDHRITTGGGGVQFPIGRAFLPAVDQRRYHTDPVGPDDLLATVDRDRTMEDAGQPLIGADAELRRVGVGVTGGG